MTKKSDAPAIRFKGFSDAWEQRKVSDLAEKTYGGGTPTTSNEAYWNGDIPWIQSSDVVDGKLLGVEPRKWITQDGLNNSAAQLIPGNSIAIITRVGVGKLAFMPYSYATSQDFLSLSKLNAEPLFTVYACYKKLQSELNAVQGTSIKGITKDELLAKNIMVPRYAEQQQIGAFFKQLDNLITLHQRKFEKLTNVKKSMLEKMFPQNGSSYPEIRFKGFTDPWEQRKFSDITFPAGEKNRDNLPLESYSITNEHGFVPQDEKFENGGTMREADKRMYYIVSPNSFAYNPARINVGSIGYQNIGKNVIVSSLYEVFKTSEDVDDRLLWHWFKSPDFQKLIMQLQEGGVRLYFYYDKLCMGEVSLPSLEEQRKIGKLFDTLDNLITLHQRKCALLFSPFQALISMMFTTSTFSWEQRKLGDVVKEITRNDPESEAPIMMITANNGFIEQSERYAFNNAGESLKKYILLKKGELAYNHGASKLRPYGSCFALTTAENARIPFVYHCFSAENQNAEFMSIELNGAEIENQLRKIVSSGARMDGLLNISFDEYTSVSVLLPGTEEQDRIADFFRHLDNLITLHQRELEKLQNIKKSMLEKMFV